MILSVSTFRMKISSIIFQVWEQTLLRMDGLFVTSLTALTYIIGKVSADITVSLSTDLLHISRNRVAAACFQTKYCISSGQLLQGL
jgi:hypothetical protein